MTTVLTIPKKDIIVHTEEMTYPVEYREEKPTVPQKFISLLEQRTNKELTGTKSEMFNQYAKELQTIEKYHRQLREFMDVVCECNMTTQEPTDVIISSYDDLRVWRYGEQAGYVPKHILDQIAARSGKAERGEGKTPFPIHLEFRKKPKYKELLKVHLESRLKELPDLSFHTPNTGRAELAAQTDLVLVKDALQDTLKKCWAYLVWMTLQSFDYLTAQEMMGVIEWHSPDVAKYNFYTGTWMERQVQQRTETHTDSEKGDGGTWHTRFTKVEREMERTYLLTRHTHDVIDAERVLPSTVDMPFKARRAADRVPDYLKSMVEVVTGNLIFMQEVQEQVFQENWTEKDQFSKRSFVRDEPWFSSDRSLYTYDPALTIGHYVVTGWV